MSGNEGISTKTNKESKFHEDYKRWKNQNPDKLFPIKPKDERDLIKEGIFIAKK